MSDMEFFIDMLLSILAIAGVLAFGLGAVVIAVVVYCLRRLFYAIKGEEYRPLFGNKTKHDYEHQDVDLGSNAESIKKVLQRYTRAVVVGKRAQAGLDALENCERKVAAFRAVLDKKFQPGSMSWDKFAVAADMTQDAVLRNSASLANRMQVFDRSGYQKERGHRSSTWRNNETANPESAEKQRVLQEGLDQMDALIASNDKLLVELDKLTIELGKLTDAESNADGERIVEEIRTLIDETKYYGQQAAGM